MRLFKKKELGVINVDNNKDASKLLTDGWEELTEKEQAIFGDEAHLAAPYNTKVTSGGSITFTPPPKSPEPTETELVQQRIAEIQQQLTANDLASVRPLRAKVAGTATAEDEARLVELEEQAQALRAELAEVSA
ncbi:hypothetical protein [Halodesulfovibrio sp.]|uniref:hypothetical protein n=1 Tax=Halodesulfovibrio sp. TaxID=1912772 RepID=UPI0025C33086|nr:hypothetical protein [Halodesulfovibrio sp.]